MDNFILLTYFILLNYLIKKKNFSELYMDKKPLFFIIHKKELLL